MSEAAPSATEAPTTPAAQAADGITTFGIDYVKELRSENAGLRVGKNEAVEAAKTAVANEFQAKLDEKDAAFATQGAALSDRELDLVKLKAIIAAGIPTDRIEELLPTLDGADADSVVGRVEALRKLMGDSAPPRVPATDPTQGGTGTKPVLPLNGDPILAELMRVIG